LIDDISGHFGDDCHSNSRIARMHRTALMTFTATPLEWILGDVGSRDWRLNAERARQCEYLACMQDRHNTKPR
jgi:hypothetical protein